MGESSRPLDRHECTVEEHRDGRRVVFEIAGDLDAQSAPEFYSTYRLVVMDGARDIMIDLTAVPFLDSSGAAALVRANLLAETYACSLSIEGVQPVVRRVLDIAGLSALLLNE